jgi:hypothetical protein
MNDTTDFSTARKSDRNIVVVVVVVVVICVCCAGFIIGIFAVKPAR